MSEKARGKTAAFIPVKSKTFINKFINETCLLCYVMFWFLFERKDSFMRPKILFFSDFSLCWFRIRIQVLSK